MITLSRCPCGGIAHIFAEESMYNNHATPWNARCECTNLNCRFELTTVAEYQSRDSAVDAIASKWNSHPIVVAFNNLKTLKEELHDSLHLALTFNKEISDETN